MSETARARTEKPGPHADRYVYLPSVAVSTRFFSDPAEQRGRSRPEEDRA